MSKFMKKAFTLVELLVVIAILVVLASVAIIGYSSFTKKAKESVDEQAVTQMNTLLTGLDVLNLPDDINEFYEQMRTAGLSAKDYKPLYADRYFFWDKDINQVVYTDKEYNVIYPEKYVGDSSINNEDHQWYSLSGKIDTSSATATIPQSAPIGNATTSISANTASDFVKLAEYTNANTPNESKLNLELDLNDDIDLMGSDTAFTNNATSGSGSVEIDGNNKTIKGLYISDNHTSVGNSADGTKGKYGNALFNAVKNLTVKNITIDGATIGSSSNPQKQTAIFAGRVTGKAYFENVTIRNCTIYGGAKSGLLFGFYANQTDGNGQEITYKNVVLENCTVISYGGEAGLLAGCYQVPSSMYDVNGNSVSLKVLDNDVTITNCQVKLASQVETYSVNNVDYVKDVYSTNLTWRVAVNNLGFAHNNDNNASSSTKEGVSSIAWKAITSLVKID